MAMLGCRQHNAGPLPVTYSCAFTCITLALDGLPTACFTG